MLKIKMFLLLTILSASSFTIFPQTEDWRQYSFSMAGFSVKYPSDWRGEEEGFGQILYARFTSPSVKDYDVRQNAGIGICTQPKGHISTVSDSRSSCRQRDDHLSDSAKDKVVSEEILEINGLKIRKKITEDKYRPTATYIYAFFTTRNRDVLISSHFPRKFNLDNCIPVFDRLLSTIKLLENETTLTYRNERYGLSLNYPTSWRSCPLDDYYTKKEDILTLVPEGKGCLSGNYVSISYVPGSLTTTKTPDLKELLRKQNYFEISPSLELSRLQTVSGEKFGGKYIYRQRYFYTNKTEPYNLLKISEMYDKERENFQQEANQILATIKML